MTPSAPLRLRGPAPSRRLRGTRAFLRPVPHELILTQGCFLWLCAGAVFALAGPQPRLHPSGLWPYWPKQEGPGGGQKPPEAQGTIP